MKQYVITDLAPEETKEIATYLEKKVGSSGLMDFFWIPLEPSLYTDIQKAHADCAPICFPLEMDMDQITCEFFLRTRKKVACDCMGYATYKQIEWVLSFLDTMLKDLNIHP